MPAVRALLCCSLLLVAGCGGGTSGPESPAVAQWATEAGGTVRVAGRNVPLRKPADVPKEPLLIEEIDLSRTKINDAQLEQLAALTHLERLRLYGTNVTDKGLQHLTAIPGLTVLELSQTRITDEGLKTLAALKSLEKLYLYNTAVTKEGVEALKAQSPGVTVYHEAI